MEEKKTRAENLCEMLKECGYKARMLKSFTYEIDPNRNYHTVEVTDMTMEAVRIGLDFGYRFQAEIIHSPHYDAPMLVYLSVPCVGKEYEFVMEGKL